MILFWPLGFDSRPELGKDVIKMMFFKKYFLPVLLLSTSLLLFSCSASRITDGTDNGQNEDQKVYVEDVEAVDSPPNDGVLEVEVKGNLPSAAYSFEEFDVDVEGDVIQIVPLAAYDSTVVGAEVLVPFQQVCRVKNLQAGLYQVRVIGRGGTVMESARVN